MSQSQPVSRPRVDITTIHGDGFNEWLAALHGSTNYCERAVIATLTYADGSTEDIKSTSFSATSEYFEFSIIRNNPLDKDVTKLTLVGCWGRGCSGKRPLIEWDGTTDNPVFRAGDTINFKVRVATAWRVSGETTGQ